MSLRKKIKLLIPLFCLSLVFVLKFNSTVLAVNDEEKSVQLQLMKKDDLTMIYMSTSDGANVQIATEESNVLPVVFKKFVTLSPDGEKVIYVTAEDLNMKNAHLYLVDLVTRKKELLATFEYDFWTSKITWSPDSKQVAFVRTNNPQLGDTGIELWRLDIYDSEQYQVTNHQTFRPELFYGTPENIIFWNKLDEITYIDYKTEPFSAYSVSIFDATGKKVAKESFLGIPTALPQLPCTVPPLSQNDPEWKNTPLNGCSGETIGSAGCALTSATMCFAYYGDVNITPWDVNNCMGEHACPFEWQTAIDVGCTGINNQVDSVEVVSFSWTKLNSGLGNGYPIIVGMSGPHFVVVTGGSGSVPSGYSINDPWDGSTWKTLATYTNAGATLSSIITYEGIPYCCPAIMDKSVYPYPNIASPGDELTFVYRIKNPWSKVFNIRLGARIRTCNPQGGWIDDPDNDRVITISPGVETDYDRSFIVPINATSGYYDTGHVIVDQDTETWCDEEIMECIFLIEPLPTTTTTVIPTTTTTSIIPTTTTTTVIPTTTTTSIIPTTTSSSTIPCIVLCEEDDSGNFDILDTSGKSGNQVVVTVKINTAPNMVDAMGFEVYYNSDNCLSYSGSYERGNLISDFDFFDCSDFAPGVLRCGGFTGNPSDAIPSAASGSVVKLTFNVDTPDLDQPEEAVRLDLQALVDDILGWSTSPGFICGGCDCDLNGDGSTTPQDALCVFQKYLGICPTSCGLCEEICGDINGDGNTTPADALCIFQEYLGIGCEHCN